MLRKFKDTQKGACVIIGNGPSLKNAPRELLEKYPTFGANKIFMLKGDLAGFVPTYYTVIDQYMIHSCAPVLVNSDWFKPEETFIRRGYPIPGSNQINLAVEPGFSLDINHKVIMGGTVTYANLQIAYYMGFTIALLVGIDHSYPGMDGKKPGSVFVADGADQDHFDEDYFEKGHIYAAPELDGVDMYYQVANEVWKADGRWIVNLTPNTKTDAFEKGEYENW